MGIITDGNEFLWDDDNVLKLIVVMVAQLWVQYCNDCSYVYIFTDAMWMSETDTINWISIDCPQIYQNHCTIYFLLQSLYLNSCFLRINEGFGPLDVGFRKICFGRGHLVYSSTWKVLWLKLINFLSIIILAAYHLISLSNR